MSHNPQEIVNEKELRLMISTTIRWEIPYFIANRQYDVWPVDSPDFVLQNASWHFRLRKDQKRHLCDIYFDLIRMSSTVSHHRFNCDLILRSTSIAIFNSFAADFNEEKNEKSSSQYFAYKLVNFYQLQNETRKEITLICVLSNDGLPVNVSSRTELLFQGTKDILCHNFKNLLLNGQDQDVTLKVRDKEFRAHQNILRARSPVLESMLSHDMVEKKSGVVDIPDCDPDAFEQFLLYLYSGEVERLDSGNMLDLFYVADKYDVGHLKAECREFIKKSLSPTNASDAIQLALDHDDATLQQSATDYFVRNVNEILPTAEWQSFVQRDGIQANELFMKAAKYLASAEKRKKSFFVL